MRLTYLDILEQCFHDKFRGYNKQEVDTFLHLVADDFKSMGEDLKDKDRQIDSKSQEIEELIQKLDEFSQQEPETKTSPEVEEELRALRKDLEKKNQLIQKLEKANEGPSNGTGIFSQLTPEMLKEKAKKIINTAKQHAEQHKANAAKELDSIQEDIQKLQQQKQQLMDNIRTTAVEHLNKFKAGTQNGNAGNSAQD
ncbi:MAG: DivIVA domain-containing protein [Nitrospinae bacterium]|nr:DivIVA domain-containing protein [Nitrospinota bacterium]MBL7020169.1 DivIVA domain-containing protein [Nitrospinaceae bacterium]